MRIRLSKQDLHECEMLGHDTVKLCEMQGFPPRLENAKQSREEANTYGFKAEYAVARLLDLKTPTLNVTSDFGVDLWWDDVSIDVKFSNRQDGDLIFDTMDKFKSRVAILVTKTESPDVMDVIGWISKKAFGDMARKANLGYGDRLLLSQDKLFGIELFWLQMQAKRFA